MKHICLIGAGALGIRHLEGLLKAKEQFDITVVERNPEAQARAKKILGDAGRAGVVSDVPPTGAIDIAIIATTSRNRADAVRELLAAADVRYLLLEKILFANETDYAGIGELLNKRDVKAWVNCPLRLMPVRKELREEVSGPVDIHFSGGERAGLMTNSMHYADYAAYLARTNEFTVDTSLLMPRLTESKRAGYYELFGTIGLNFNNGSKALCTSLPQARDRRTIISSRTVRAVFEEPANIAKISRKHTDWKWEETPAPFTFQSDMTGTLVDEILRNGDCALPGYEASATMHLAVLGAVKKFLDAHSIVSDVDFPFT